MIFPPHPYPTLLLAPGVICGVFEPLAAGPALLEYRELADEERAFADINRLQIDVLPLLSELEAVGLHPTGIMERAVNKCRAANITITEDISTPRHRSSW